MSTENEEHSFFGFRTFDRNSNEIDLSKFKDKDYICVINCITEDEAEERAAYYITIEDKFEKKVQLLCIQAAKFFYTGHQDEQSQRLITFLKEKSNCHNEVEDGLIFVVDNHKHSVSNEVITCIGDNLEVNQLADKISMAFN